MSAYHDIFQITTEAAFEEAALALFRVQAEQCEPYRNYLELLGVDPRAIERTTEIPFLPIELFKSHRIYCAAQEPQITFTSSATTGMIAAKHPVADLSLYEEAFTRAFERTYGPIEQVPIFALLPSYLEREGSSLIYMVDHLIRHGGRGGFYLRNHEQLRADMAACAGRKILLGVSYALWDLAEEQTAPLHDTIVMETGGMKGHRPELPREEFHALLSEAFGVEAIHSEYGMAELMSQAYSTGEGVFVCPPWMQVRVRDLNDPFAAAPEGRVGGINVIDLANRYSCAFLQTQDLGQLLGAARFRILGRISGSDIRGCNLLVQ